MVEKVQINPLHYSLIQRFPLGLVDTAVKTAETGYMQRRLVKCLEDLCCQYDMTIRTCTNDIVQFTYGGDSLDPIYLEGKDKPVDYDRIYQHVRAKYRYDNEHPLGGHEMNEYVRQELEKNEYSIMEHAYRQQIIEFIHQMSSIIDNFRKRYQITDLEDEEHDAGEASESTTGRKRPSLRSTRSNKKPRIASNVLYEVERCTQSQLFEFLQLCKYKYGRARLEPGTAVGALCAQSIGEPATQMTLKSLFIFRSFSKNFSLALFSFPFRWCCFHEHHFGCTAN